MVEEQVVVVDVNNYKTSSLYTSFSKSSIHWHTVLGQLRVWERPLEQEKIVRYYFVFSVVKMNADVYVGKRWQKDSFMKIFTHYVR